MTLKTNTGQQYNIDTTQESKSGRMKDVWFCSDGINVAALYKKPLNSRDEIRLKKIINVFI
jgi:hypothetical protein